MSTYSTYSTYEEELAVGMLSVVLVVYLAIFAVGITSYILNSLALQRLGKRRQIPNAWMAWVPFTSSYLMGRIVDDYDEKNGLKKRWGLLLLILNIVSVAILVISYIKLFSWMIDLTIWGESLTIAELYSDLFVVYGGLIIAILAASALSFCKAVCVYKIFESTVPNRSILYFILYLVVPLGGPICLFSCRNKGYDKQPTMNMPPTYPMMNNTMY